MSYTYIKKNVSGFYATFPEKMSPELYDNLGETYQDFLDDKWVLLSEEQVAFHEANPSASVKQVFDMKLPEPHVRDLRDAKNEMLANISRYDNSEEVNGFSFEGVPGKYWFTVQERLNYKQSVEAAKILEKDEVSFYVGNMAMSVNVDKAVYLLAKLQEYADECYMVTKAHELAVNALETIEEVDAYDYKAGYPESPVFNLLG